MPPKKRRLAVSTLTRLAKKSDSSLATTCSSTAAELVRRWYSKPPTANTPKTEKTRPRTRHFRQDTVFPPCSKLDYPRQPRIFPHKRRNTKAMHRLSQRQCRTCDFCGEYFWGKKRKI